MPLALVLFLLATGGSVGFLSGLLGIGGGIIMFPLLLYGPPLAGLPPIPVKDITGLTMVQGLFASLSALLFYHQQRLVNRELVLSLGGSLFFSSLIGSFASRYVEDKPILFIFALLALTASVLMLLPRNYGQDNVTEEVVKVNKAAAVPIGIVVGAMIGLVGQGGAFITIPLMLYVLKIPLRVALGSTLAIGLFSATAGTAGKAVTGQVPWLLTIPLVIAAIPGAWIGGIVGRKTDTRVLKWILAMLITASAVKIWLDLF